MMIYIKDTSHYKAAFYRTFSPSSREQGFRDKPSQMTENCHEKYGKEHEFVERRLQQHALQTKI